MLKKILLSAFVFVLAVNIASSQTLTQAQKNLLGRSVYSVKIIGDAIGGEKVIDMKVDKSRMTNIPNLPSVSIINGVITKVVNAPDLAWTITYTPTGGQTIYDLQSNGVPQQIWQDPNTTNNIHSVLMVCDYGDEGFTQRISKYFFSADGGTTWAFIGNAGVVSNGYCAITGTSEGNALIANHGANGGAPTRTQYYYDAAPGLGSFTLLDPPSPGSVGYIWPRLEATNSISNTVKFVGASSPNGPDSAFHIYSNSLETNNFGPWTFFLGDQAETYSVAKSASGAKIGLLYKANDVLDPNSYGDAFFIESTNDGMTWSTPLKIFHANFNTDSLGCLRGLNLIYKGEDPKAVFETVKITREGSYFPGLPAKIRFWSTTLPGSDPDRSIVLADTSDVGYHPNFGTNDVYSTLARPTIGRSADGVALFCAFQVPSDLAGGSADTTPYRDYWAKVSGDGGSTWSTAIKLNYETPRFDWTYGAVSKINHQDAQYYYFNMTILVDTIPGSFVQGAGNGKSLAQQFYMKVQIPKNEIISVKNVSTEIPNAYSLLQNYPNPFNPSTTIRFELPKATNVTLKIYNINGQEVASLINNTLINAGTSEYTFDASNLSTGIYFYSIQAGNFKDTKKMVLIK
ncbi:MAG: T9SS type A sorting domain-containing protein [Ignavibacteria bacterium]|nr:T9SS type A sorting domain-containing protein [Ignavibacteria bacterium]